MKNERPLQKRELRIGNYFQLDGVGTYKRVVEIKQDVVQSETTSRFVYGELFGIVIFPQWLIDNGFQQGEVQYTYHIQIRDKVRLQIFIDDYTCRLWQYFDEGWKESWYELPIRVRYIHELQNLYSIFSGMELNQKP